MKKLLLFLIAMLIFSSFCLAVDSSPPTNNECKYFTFFQTNSDSELVFTTNVDSLQHWITVENKLIPKNAKVLTVSLYRESPAKPVDNQLIATTFYKTVDLQQDLQVKNGFNGNIENKIRAEPQTNSEYL